MKALKVTLSYFLFMFFFSACNDVKKNTNSKNSDLMTVLDGYKLKYGAITAGDSSLNKYTYSFQKRFIEDQKLMVTISTISDIFKKGNIYILQILESGVRNRYIIQIILDSLQFEDFKTNMPSNNLITGCFVLKVLKVNSLSPSLELNYDPGDPGDDDHDATDPYLSIDDFGDGRMLELKAVIVDYHLL